MSKSKKKIDEELDTQLAKEIILADQQGYPNFTGIARSIQCFKHNRKFNDYRIITLYVKDNLVEKIDYSDPYGGFEVLDHLNIYNQRSFDNLLCNYKDEKAFVK